MKNLLLSLFLALLASLLSAEALLYSRNTLYLNDHWISRKRLLEMGVPGSDEFLLSRNTLARDRLNLDTWYGYEDIYSRLSFTPSLIEFGFEIPDDSYLDVTWGRAQGAFSGLRLSRRALFPSMTFESTNAGAFTETHMTAPLEVSPGHHVAVIDFDHSRLTLDRMEIPLSLASKPGPIGFRAGLAGAHVSHVRVHSGFGDDFAENFRNSRDRTLATASSLALCLALATLITLAARTGARSFCMNLALLSVAVLACGGVGYIFDFYYWSALPFHTMTTPLQLEAIRLPPQKLEDLRYSLFGKWGALLGKASPSHQGFDERGYTGSRLWGGPFYCDRKPGSCRPLERTGLNSAMNAPRRGKRMLFVGNSFMVGTGAETLQETVFARLHDAIRIESLNMSVYSHDSQALFEKFEREYAAFRPDLIVFCPGSHDSKERFDRGLDLFLNYARDHRIRFILIEDTRSSERGSLRFLNADHQTLRKQAARFHAPLLSLQEILHRPEIEASGALWWDAGHLTSYGQELVAKELAPLVISTISKRP